MTEQENILRLAREAFEFDLIDNHCYVQSDFVQQDGCYIDDDVDFAWQATLAVVIAILPAIGEVVKAETVAETQEACAKVCMDKAFKMEREAQSALEEEDEETCGSNRAAAWLLSACAREIAAMGATPSRNGEA